MTTIVTTPQVCSRCGTALTTDQRYCSNCGRKVQKSNPRIAIFAVVAGLAAWGIFVLLSGKLTGSRPTEQFTKNRMTENAAPGELPPGHVPEPSGQSAGDASDSADTNDSGQIPSSPEEIKALTSKAFNQVDALSSASANPAGGANQELVLETVDSLSRLVKADPTNSWALLQLAELSFAQQVFDKAASYYEKYLAVVPDDVAVRARYAGSLNFIGKSAQAISELEPLRKADPENFQVLGYLAVSYAQAGNVIKAKEIGTEAIQKAPDETARARFASFVEKLGTADSSSGIASGSGVPANAKSVITSSDGQFDLKRLDTYLKANPIAGRFFVGTEQQGKTVVLKFNNFPMQAMPEFVRNKFLANVTEQLPNDQDLKLRFEEASSGNIIFEK